MSSWTPLETYDPDWETRWERCHAVLQASRAEQRAEETEYDVELAARCSRELNALHAAYHAQFSTVEAYRDHFMAFEVGAARGLDVVLPHFPEGASLQEVDALLRRYREDTRDARRERYRPLAADPPNLSAFTAVPRSGCERAIETFSLPRDAEGGSVDCLLVMEATRHDVHACFVSRCDGGSIPNNIERLATHLYRERFAPHGTWHRTRAFLGKAVVGTYAPTAIRFYDYWPFNLGGSDLKENFSAVILTWRGRSGFVEPKWKQFPSTPVFVDEVARPPALQVRKPRHRLLADKV